MGDQRERNRIKSRVDELPDEIRAQLDAMLADVNYTYQDIADTITDLGYEISRSAVGRYAMRHNSANTTFERGIRADHGAAAIHPRESGRRVHGAGLRDYDRRPDPQDRNGGRRLRRHAAGQGGPPAGPAATQSTIYKERWRKERLAAIEAVERNVKARMRQAVQNDPELLAQLQRLVSDAAAEEAGRDEG